MELIRHPAVAGAFYPRFREELSTTIHECFTDSKFGPGKEFTPLEKVSYPPRHVIGGVCPHAGYIYSGSVTTCTIQAICEEHFPDTVIILGTQHTGYFDIALMREGSWETPFGKIKVDTEVADAILAETTVIQNDDAAFNGYPHGREHNIEVQLPFLQYVAQKMQISFQFVPIVIGRMKESDLQALGKAIATVIQKNAPKKDIAIIASSDMTHYQPKNPRHPRQEIMQIQHQKDLAVIKAFEQFNWKDTFARAKETSVCGPQTITTLLIIGKELSAQSTKALKYYTSFEKMGEEEPSDYSVGYFSGIILK